jgi:DNA-binding transcriptional ArsR family regulator
MMTMRFGARALAHVRFAISPMVEARRSLRVLDDPGGQALHLPWVIEARRRTADLDLAPLRALDPTGVYTPDFVSPPPTGPLAELEDELAAIAATPPAQVRAEVRRTYRGQALPAVLEPFVEDPAAAVVALAGLLRDYWDRALASHWPRLRALLEGDVLYRARQMADGGAQRLFADVDPTVSWADGVLSIEKSFEETLDLEERGLLFVPSVFAWPRVLLITDPQWQPTLVYPARGVGTLWEPARPAAADALAGLLGRVRAGVLTALDRPRSTTDLAGALDISTGGVSQHLGVLRKAGLVHGHRVGRVVLYQRSPAGDGLVAAAASEP